MATFLTRKDALEVPAPTARPFIELWNPGTQGLGLRVMKKSDRTGEVRRVFLARFKDEQGKDKKAVIGDVAEWSLERAQREALRLRATARSAREAVPAETALPTLGAALEEYLAGRAGKLRPTTVFDYKKRWGYLKDHHDSSVLALGSKWWEDTHLKLMDFGRPTADGVLRIAHAVYQSLVDDERMTVNPVRRVASKQEIFAHPQPRKPVIAVAELPVLWKWLETRAHVSVRDWVRIALLTGLRDAVVGHLRWDQVHLDLGALVVPAEVRGNKAGQTVLVPVCDWLMDNVLRPRHKARQASNPWVLPSTRKAGQPLTDIRGSMQTFKQECGGIHVNPHKLRRTFATNAHRAVGSALTAGRMLTHSQGEGAFDNAAAVARGYITKEFLDMKEAFTATAALTLHIAEHGELPKKA